jgi:hypothetical protein
VQRKIKAGWLPPGQITKPRWLPELTANKKNGVRKETADIALKILEIRAK